MVGIPELRFAILVNHLIVQKIGEEVVLLGSLHSAGLSIGSTGLLVLLVVVFLASQVGVRPPVESL